MINIDTDCLRFEARKQRELISRRREEALYTVKKRWNKHEDYA